MSPTRAHQPAHPHRRGKRRAGPGGLPDCRLPARASFREHVRALAAAADVVEIGVPFTDPMADGVTIQRASLAALAQGVSLRGSCRAERDRRRCPRRCCS